MPRLATYLATWRSGRRIRVRRAHETAAAMASPMHLDNGPHYAGCAQVNLALAWCHSSTGRAA